MALIDWTRKIGKWFRKIPIIPQGKVYGPAPPHNTKEEIEAYMQEQHELEVASGKQETDSDNGTQDNPPTDSAESE